MVFPHTGQIVLENKTEKFLVQTYLKEEWALVLGLRAGRPEPVRQWSSLRCGNEVAQSHRLLQDVESLLMGLHTVGALALQRNIDEINEQKTLLHLFWIEMVTAGQIQVSFFSWFPASC